MTLGIPRRIAALAIMALIAWLAIEPALAQAPTPPTPNKGDTAWMLTATVLVLLMTIPGLALFYGGLVRTKNMLSMLMQVFYTVCVVCIIWVLYGYSMAFTEGTIYNSLFGSFSKAFLAGVTPESNVETFTQGVVIPEFVYICFQMTFACITPALIVGAMAERMKFSAIALFIPLWVTFVYFPIAHMVWYWAGPEAIVGAAKAIADAGADAAKKQAAEAALATVNCQCRPRLPVGCARFRGRHGGAHQLRHRRARRRAGGRQARRLRQGSDASPFADADAGRRRTAVGWLVRLQRGLRPRSRRHRRAGDDSTRSSPRRRQPWPGCSRRTSPRASRACWVP